MQKDGICPSRFHQRLNILMLRQKTGSFYFISSSFYSVESSAEYRLIFLFSLVFMAIMGIWQLLE